MENIQGYAIEKSVLFENNRGFALGHNPAAPQPYVTWQFTESEGGVRDYYWGHYHTDREWAERDFSRRIDDYQYLFKVEEKEPGQEPGGYYRYYSTQRPFERMMKEVPWPGRGSDDPCAGCRYHKECRGKKNQCRKKFRALVVKPRTSGQRGPKS